MPNILKAFISGLSAKEKKILYIAVGCMCLAFFDRLVLGPICQEANLLEERIVSQTELIQKNLMILQYKDKIISEDEAHNIFYAKLDSTHEQRIASFLSEVEELAKSAGIPRTNVNPVFGEEKKGYVQYNLTFECAGKMDNLVDLIYKIENSKKPIRVISYEISPKSRENYEAKCTLTVAKIIVMPDGSLAPIESAVSEEASFEEEES
ncbi:hypothetical protein ACFL38_00755 [Candidatus Omnitrophota bacterium]